MEFVEETQAIVKNDLETDVETHFIQVAADCATLSSMSPVASRSDSFVASSYSTSEMALCSSSPTALSLVSSVASCSRKDDNFGSSQVSYDNAKIQQLIQENADLLLKNKVLQQQLARKNKLFKKEMKKKFQDMLSPFFTPGQIKMILNPMQKMTHWSSEDIAAAISLRSVSPKAYRYLTKTKKIPLPALSTLWRWVANFNIDEGIYSEKRITNNEIQKSKYDRYGQSNDDLFR